MSLKSIFEHWCKAVLKRGLPGRQSKKQQRRDSAVDANRGGDPAVTETTGGQGPAEAGEQVAEGVKRDRDDLSKIKGIGPATAQKLNGLGIVTIEDLAKADANDLAKRLGGSPVTPQRARKWIEEAGRQER